MYPQIHGTNKRDRSPKNSENKKSSMVHSKNLQIGRKIVESTQFTEENQSYGDVQRVSYINKERYKHKDKE